VWLSPSGRGSGGEQRHGAFGQVPASADPPLVVSFGLENTPTTSVRALHLHACPSGKGHAEPSTFTPLARAAAATGDAKAHAAERSGSIRQLNDLRARADS
jgi:hypothetical protein